MFNGIKHCAMKSKRHYVALEVSPTLKKTLIKLAKAEGRDLSNFLRLRLKEMVSKNGDAPAIPEA